MKNFRRIKRNEPAPTREEIIMRHKVIRHNNGDFHIEREPHLRGDIDILREIIRDAKKRIAMYKELDKGLWASIFRTDNSEPIKEEEALIQDWQRMIDEIEIWTSRYDNAK